MHQIPQHIEGADHHERGDAKHYGPGERAVEQQVERKPFAIDSTIAFGLDRKSQRQEHNYDRRR